MIMTTQRTHSRCFGDRSGFTFVELLVAIAIIGLLLASVIPFIAANREMSRRVTCANNLRTIFWAMATYQKAYVTYPMTRSDDATNVWTAYTGADEANPFAPGSAVQPNDVTAPMWLLVRIGYVEPSIFVCPSSPAVRDPLTNAAGAKVKPEQRGNFRSKRNLSYSLLSPYNPSRELWNDTLPSGCVLMADMNPGISPNARDDVTRPAAGDAPEIQQLANSNNHGKAGQNVLYASGDVAFVAHAFVGMEYIAPGTKDAKGLPVPPRAGDNIFTSLTASPNTPDGRSPSDGPGAFGKDVRPSWSYDSYLLPSDDE